MSDSYPTIQDSLSDVQKEFMGCVETHLDPPEHDDPSYRVQARYLYDDPAHGLPGSEIVFTVSVDEHDDDISERRHMVEFRSAGHDQPPAAWVRHVMKRVEGANGRFFWTESRFEVAGPGVPKGETHLEDVEREVLTVIDAIRAREPLQGLPESPINTG